MGSGGISAGSVPALTSMVLGVTPSSEHARYDVARANRLSVLSFNMKHRDREDELEIMSERLRKDLAESPDFILLQEVVFDRSDSKGHDSTAAELAENLGYHMRGTKRSSDREGVAILSKYPFTYYDQRELKSQTSRLLLGFNRVSVMAEFQVPSVGLVRVVNVHLTNWGFESRVRSNQLQETLDWLTQRERDVPAAVTFLGGDFNIQPQWKELQLIDKANAAKAIEFENYNGDEPTRGSPGRPTKRVDYVFVSAPQRTVEFLGEQRLWMSGLREADGDRFWPSDHVPVLHEYVVFPGSQLAAGPESPSVAAQ